MKLSWKVILLISILGIFLSGCTSETKYVCPDGTVVLDSTQCTIEEEKEQFQMPIYDKTCSFNTECYNGGVPVAKSCTETLKQECVDGHCQWQEAEKVGCTIDSCCDAGEVCDLLTHTCIKSGSTGFCGDGKCSFSNRENQNTCPADC